MPTSPTGRKGHGFGTAPVFLAAISTILGAILFLRFGYAVANVGALGALLIIFVAHAITIPTGLAVAEIATNLKVEGGGEYYIISRSFGRTVGGAIGLSLYMSQAISVAFYVIAFAEAFRPVFAWVEATWGLAPDIRMVSLPAAVILLVVILYKGADLGVSALWVVVGVLAISLGAFFLGRPDDAPGQLDLLARVGDPDSFSVVFAIVFPAFTGMTAGVGLSGDLANPRRSIPLGTMAGTLCGMAVYILVVFKMAMSASPETLSDQFAMSHIALWGPIIPIGLAAATISSAIGSILVAPRTLQALSADDILPSKAVNRVLSSGRGEANEPFNATLVTAMIVLVFVSLGSVDFVAQIISMFFMVTYGALCAISFLQHFAGNPSYRPTFRSRWYVSLAGAVACLVMMWEMQPLYTVLAWALMGALYLGLRAGQEEDEQDISGMVQGAVFQLARYMQVLVQKRYGDASPAHWRPSMVAVSRASTTRLAPFDLLRWFSQHFGFGTFIHFIEGKLEPDTQVEARRVQAKLVEQIQHSHAGVYVDTIVSPSFRSAVAQIVQTPGVSGLENNSALFEFHKGDDGALVEILDGSRFAVVAGMNACVLRSSERHFGYRRSVHVWLTHGDYRNANLMILLAYILVGHKDWRGAEVKLFAAFPAAELAGGAAQLGALIADDRIPISRNNVQLLAYSEGTTYQDLVNQRSEGADLVITGFSLSKAEADGGTFFTGFDAIEDLLFVRATEEILISS